MEIKCKVSFTLPEELVDALELTDDTPIIASVSGNRITLEFADDEFEDTEALLSFALHSTTYHVLFIQNTASIS